MQSFLIPILSILLLHPTFSYSSIHLHFNDFTYPPSKYLLIALYVSATVSGAGGTVVNKIWANYMRCLANSFGKWIFKILVIQYMNIQSAHQKEASSCYDCGTHEHCTKLLQRSKSRTSLVAQWLRICLPMQGTQVRALVWEDPTCHGATKPVRHNYWACALEPEATTTEPTCHNYWAHVLQLLKPVCLEPVLRNKRSPRTATKSSPCSPKLEKARAQQRRPNAAKNKINKIIKKKKSKGSNHL